MAATHGHEVRRRLLAAAAELIPERGWTAVSTRILAQRAEVSPSVVHYHFSSVAAVLNEAAVELMRHVLAEVDASLETARTPAEAVDAMLASADRYTGSDPASLLFIEAYLAANRDERLREELGSVVDGFHERFGAWLGEHGVHAPKHTATAIMAAVDGLLLHRGLGAEADTMPIAMVLRRLLV